MHLRRITALGAATVLSLATATALSTQPASADPGFCGVRAFGPKGSGAKWIYAVRNKCSKTHSFRIVLSAAGKQVCKPISPNDWEAWSLITLDKNWWVEAC
ncbi:hypothetical protein J4573_24815 [Actinomadura barringtoniae]|uniref:Secreted protein n=1 Tax=Actinomadura barringtoniae TaxID=1427535 RepID=A0A939PDQ1_9ACTN|nr:hypothetical protein [Actinomadura barringtoniae]MBO2450347.1 hypothetical protein [Actinomadura barringtoniae]